MQTFLEVTFTFIKMIVVSIAVIIELPIKLTATISFVTLFIIMSFFAPIFRSITCPKWWEAYSNYAIKWKHNWRIVKWTLDNYDY